MPGKPTSVYMEEVTKAALLQIAKDYGLRGVSGAVRFLARGQSRLEAENARMAAQLRDLARQLDNGLARRLGSDGPPSHIDYVSKKDAAAWCARLAAEIHAILAPSAGKEQS